MNNKRGSSCLVWLLMGAVPGAALLPGDAYAVGEQVARLKGKVLEAGTGVPIPGMKVEVRSSSLIGGARSVLTDEEGSYDFLNLPPGKYNVTFTVEGVKPVRRSVNLDVGQTQDLPLQFSAELTKEEVITVVEQSKRIDTERANVGRVLRAEQQEKIASARSYQSVVQQLPGVTGGGNPVMAGGSSRHNRYLVNGLDITDPVTNTFSANFNFDTINQLEALTLPVDAQYNSMGGVINLITKRGGNKFTVDTSFYFNHQALSAGGQAGTRLYEGRRFDQSDPRPPTASYQANLNIGGPIVKDRVWFYLAQEFRYNLSSVVPGPPLNVQHPSRIFIGYYPQAKLTFALAARHQLEVSFNADPAWISNAQQNNAYAANAEYNQAQLGQFGTLTYDWAITDNLFFKLQTGVVAQRLVIRPETDDPLNPGHYDRTPGVQIYSNHQLDYIFTDDQRQRFQFDPTFTWVKRGWLGEHTFKAGVQFQYIRRYVYQGAAGNRSYESQVGTGALARDASSTEPPTPCNDLQPRPVQGSTATPCFRSTFDEPAAALVRGGVAVGAFVQDTWKPASWLTVAPGLRLDYGRATNSLGEVTHNLLGFGPRIFAALDLTRDGKTVVKAAYGRANEVSTLLNVGALDTGFRQTTWSYNATTGRFDSFYTAGGGPDGYDLRGRCADGTYTKECGNAALSLNPPRADYVTASLERELYKNVIGRITYTHRTQSWGWEDYYLNQTRPLDGGNIIQNNQLVVGVRPTPDAIRRYNGLDLELTAQGQNWDFVAAYTLSFLEGSYDDVQGPRWDDPPRNFRLNGYLPDDHRHMLKVQASYEWRGLTLGLNMEYLTGGPATRTYLQALGQTGRYAWFGVDPTSDPNDIRKWTELRSPDLMTINLRARYDVGALLGNRLGRFEAIADLFNALDLAAPVGANNQAGFRATDGALFGTVSARQQPFRAQLAVRYRWN